jgi:hypothetical protein
MRAYMSVKTTTPDLSAKLLAVGSKVQKGSGAITWEKAKELQFAVRAHAEGRPGPEKVTGDYWDSIKAIAKGFTSEVSTDKPFARRLEYGFVGVDSLGRHYHQPPYPHWAPAVAEVEPEYHHALEALVRGAIEF